MNRRIEEVRKAEGLTQDEFAKRLGMSRSFINQVAVGKREVSDRTISDICREFGIREEWLRTGNGSMKEEKPRNEVLTEKLNGILTAGDDDFRKRLIAVLVELPSGKWSILEEMAESVVNGTPAPDAAPAHAPRNVHDWTREEMDAEYKRQMDAEATDREKGTTAQSTGFPNVSGADCA